MDVSVRGNDVTISGGPGVAITLGRREAVVLARDILTAVVG